MQAPALIAEIEAALASDGLRRVEMLSRITDLFVSGAARYSEEQIALFDDVMVRLASAVDAAARAKLARRLAPIANAPKNLIRMLALDEGIEVARPNLDQSEPERGDRAEPAGEAELYRLARDRKFEETARMLSALCDTPIGLVEAALLDPTAEIILILARVARLSSATTKALLLLRATNRGMSATAVDQALFDFERLQPAAARRVLDFFRTRLKKPAQPAPAPVVAADL